jgi:hypothetical protein
MGLVFACSIYMFYAAETSELILIKFGRLWGGGGVTPKVIRRM